MDIIEVARSRLKASLDEAVFDLNSALVQPLEEGSKDKFSKALYKYSHTTLELDTLLRLEKQMNDQASKTEAEAE